MTTPPPPTAVPPAQRKKVAGITCGSLVLLVVLVAIVGAIISPAKKTSAMPILTAGPQTTPAATAPTPTTAAPTTAAPAAAPPTSPTPAASKPAKPAAIHLARGSQHGLTNCVITYKDAQDGAGTSTFTAIVLDDSGQPYAPTGSNPYSILLQVNLTDISGTAYPVTEALGSGSRTAADNPGGSDWFTTDQGDTQVSANSTEGLVKVTVSMPLAQMKSVEGNIMITSQSDENYLKQTECAVRPG